MFLSGYCALMGRKVVQLYYNLLAKSIRLPLWIKVFPHRVPNNRSIINMKIDSVEVLAEKGARKYNAIIAFATSREQQVLE